MPLAFSKSGGRWARLVLTAAVVCLVFAVYRWSGDELVTLALKLRDPLLQPGGLRILHRGADEPPVSRARRLDSCSTH